MVDLAQIGNLTVATMRTFQLCHVQTLTLVPYITIIIIIFQQTTCPNDPQLPKKPINNNFQPQL